MRLLLGALARAADAAGRRATPLLSLRVDFFTRVCVGARASSRERSRRSSSRVERRSRDRGRRRVSTTGRAVVALSASASWEGVFLEKNTYSSSFEGYRRNRRHDRRVVVI